MSPELRARIVVWLNAGHRDGYDGHFNPPKVSDKHLPAYLAGWERGTADCILDAVERKEKNT